MSFEAYARRQARGLFDKLTDRLVQDLSTAAREEAEAAAAEARREADAAAQAAGAELAAARAELTAARAELSTARADGEARLAAAQALNAGLLETVDAARQEALTTQAAAEAELDRTRQELEAQVEEARQERAEIRRAYEEAVAERDAETLRAEGLAERLEAELVRASETGEAVEAARRERVTVVDRVRTALHAIDRATTPSEVLDALLEPLAHDCGRAAVFLVGASGLKGWRGRGLDGPADVAALAIPKDSDSLPARAAAHRQRLSAVADGAPLLGAWGTPVTHAVALPVLAGDRVIAVAYGEDEREATLLDVGAQIVEMLVDHVSLRLATKPSTARRPDAALQPAPYSPARQAPRLKIQDDVDLTVDGSTSSLVDLSSIGAQILSPLAVRPNRVLRMMMRAGKDALACRARVMWARYEQRRGSTAAQYRVGVKFTDVEPKAVEAFLSGHGAIEVTR